MLEKPCVTALRLKYLIPKAQISTSSPKEPQSLGIIHTPFPQHQTWTLFNALILKSLLQGRKTHYYPCSDGEPRLIAKGKVTLPRSPRKTVAGLGPCQYPDSTLNPEHFTLRAPIKSRHHIHSVLFSAFPPFLFHLPHSQLRSHLNLAGHSGTLSCF